MVVRYRQTHAHHLHGDVVVDKRRGACDRTAITDCSRPARHKDGQTDIVTVNTDGFFCTVFEFIVRPSCASPTLYLLPTFCAFVHNIIFIMIKYYDYNDEMSGVCDCWQKGNNLYSENISGLCRVSIHIVFVKQGEIPP